MTMSRKEMAAIAADWREYYSVRTQGGGNDRAE